MTTVYAKGFDCWGAGPSPAAAVAAGYVFRTWYSSADSSKDGGAPALAAYTRAGVAALVNFETTVNRVMAGYAAGYADARHAVDEYTPRGMPQGASVWFSADEPIAVSDIPKAVPYYVGTRAGLASRGRYLNAAYGEEALLAALYTARIIDVAGWRSMSTAWPGGLSTVDVGIVQNGPGSIGGVPIDVDDAIVPLWQLGAWLPGRLLTAPGPTPPNPIPQQEVDVTTYFPIQVGPDPAGTKPWAAGVASWPAGDAHVLQLIADPGEWGDNEGQFRLVFALTSGPDVEYTHVAKPTETTAVEFAKVPGLVQANCRGVTITRPDGKTWPWGGGAA